MTDFKEDVQEGHRQYPAQSHSRDGNDLRATADPTSSTCKQAQWVELVDSDDRTIRIAVRSTTHLPIRKSSKRAIQPRA